MSEFLTPKELLLRQIVWTKIGPAHWTAYVDGQLCELRMNDFPEEPLFTIIVNGRTLDINDAPRAWARK